MTTSVAKQLKLVLWKNYVLQKRRKVGTIVELLLPVVFFAILVVIRQVISQSEEPAEIFGSIPTHLTPIQIIDDLPNNSGARAQLLKTCGSNFNYYLSNFYEANAFVGYTPIGGDVDRVMQVLGNATGFTFHGYANVNDMISDTVNGPNADNFVVGLVFHGLGAGHTLLNDVSYDIRFPPAAADNDKNTWYTKNQKPQFADVGPRTDNAYLCSGFYFLQSFVDRAVMHILTNVSADIVFPAANFTSSGPSVVPPVLSYIQQFPYPQYNDDPFQFAVAGTLPLFMILSWMFPCQSIVRQIVFEKERRLREAMKMMGLRNWVNWLGWFIKSLIYLTISVVIVTIVVKTGDILPNSDAFLLFVFFWLFCIATISFSFLISVFFQRAKIAAAFGTIIYFFAYVPYFFIDPRYDDLSAGVKTGACVLSSTCVGIGATIMASLESQGVGATWSNLHTPATVDDNITLGTVMGMFFFDAILYLVLAWYIEGIYPGEYGIPQRWYFPFQRSYWFGSARSSNNVPMSTSARTPLRGSSDQLDQSDSIPADADPKNFEAEPSGLKAGIRIDNLTKTYADKKTAVRNLSLNMYEGQITALLGHNGAGKTTTMSIITGMIPATSGTAYVDGYDITTSSNRARDSLGLCPQHDILFDSMTVHEHLDFYASLKGVDKSQLEREITEMISDLGFTDKTNYQSQALSGGMKRKLSVAIALIGGSRVVILDEPTAGMDPYARRATWDLLLRHKARRTILLTTHYMDEADIMGDRIAIMAEGQLRCLGSSLFLKSRYGIGYHMTLVKEPRCNVNSITALVKSHVASAVLATDVGAELAYVLPTRETPNFANLFAELENRKVELGIGSFGVSITTLEEVFLKVGEGFDTTIDEVKEQEKAKASKDKTLAAGGGYGSGNSEWRGSGSNSDRDLLIPVNDNGPSRNEYATGFALKRQQFKALLRKRMLISYREKKQVIMQLILPMYFVLIALVSVRSFPPNTSDPSLTLLASDLGSGTVSRYASDQSLTGRPTGHYFGSYLHTVAGTQVVNASNSLPSGTSDIASYFFHQTPTAKDVSYFYAHNYGMLLDYEEDASNIADIGFPLAGTAQYSTVLYNNNAYHTGAMFLNIMSNALLNTIAQTLADAAGTVAPAMSIRTTNYPMPMNAQEAALQAQDSAASLSLGFNVLFGLSFLASSFILFLVQERASKAKHLQFISGVDAVSYWLSTYLWDLTNYLVPVSAIMIVIVGFKVDGYSGENLALALLLLLLYGWAILPFTYLFSFLFKLPMNAYSFTVFAYSITGIGSLIATFILDQQSLGLVDVNEKLKWVFLLLPNYCLGRGFLDIYQNYMLLTSCGISPIVAEKCHEAGFNWVDSMSDWADPGLARKFIFMFVEGLVLFVLVILIELRVFVPSRLVAGAGVSTENEDADVAAERRRVVSGEAERKGDTVVIKNLTKLFKTQGAAAKKNPTLVAVNELCVGIPAGECFGLLGVNGAGKTTTFCMLTGDTSVSSGNAMMDGFSILNQQEEVRRRIGYCPQFDALIDLMTGRELLALYARLRGVPESAVLPLVDSLIDRMNLTKHAKKNCGTYSGGNKRKLSTALALIGDPPIVFLDEMSAGIDVAGRRFLWDFISSIMRNGRSIILTSHSMEECEALCTRLAIMVNGEFKCIGSPQHLKNRFGSGYTMTVKLQRDLSAGAREPDTFPVKQFVHETFPGAVLKEEHQGALHYEIATPEQSGSSAVKSLSWAFIFSKMEEAKRMYPIEDYGVSQTSLEQVFIEFAKRQRTEDDE
ncbi:ATP-binding cassette sub-family A member 1 [Capsaspora owczarzaki ATCC 30864]|uniref:ATP-binding cassette sub-family A member 1 n=1 Tax=Capsaspora owczarzaki (strain ATCC 30864) TaxID=595528 RepID=A0A0D2WIP3_CAPO3|nr:ATP-binding cassette sub-family A member 1 [Capsaspora owczarzaki ATCC 30864]KJE88968.1 ATP-binding cassette sub-family A member 1 [Capsaspora owczarzaki ATCC 30864]|eukprot:XP_004365404.2 ATP-binding cassette sub-family A member 1 [Capsaspora owczarzaki ATCC 30864]